MRPEWYWTSRQTSPVTSRTCAVCRRVSSERRPPRCRVCAADVLFDPTRFYAGWSPDTDGDDGVLICALRVGGAATGGICTTTFKSRGTSYVLVPPCFYHHVFYHYS